jgi:hypothetical protein
MLIEDLHFLKLKMILLVRKHIPSRNLGPLNTRAKSHDHEVVRAQKKVSKAVPRHLQHHVVLSRTLKCSVKPYVTGLSTKCYFNESLLIHVLAHDKIE